MTDGCPLRLKLGSKPPRVMDGAGWHITYLPAYNVIHLSLDRIHLSGLIANIIHYQYGVIGSGSYRFLPLRIILRLEV